MKNLYGIIFIGFCLLILKPYLSISQALDVRIKACINSSLQTWAPLGAKWYYDDRFVFSGNVDYILYSSVRDTIVAGKNCHKISKRNDLVCNERPQFELMYDSRDSVFFYDPHLNVFQLLYNFNAVKNDSWSLKIHEASTNRNDTLNILVDSIGSMVANNQLLKILYVTYSVRYETDSIKYQSQIAERFGDLAFMFNFLPFTGAVCDFNLSDGIRCYEDSVLGYYHFPLMDSCTYQLTGINPDNSHKLVLYPNPSDDIIRISGLDTQASYQLIDLTGITIESGIIYDSQIEISQLPEGIYMLRINDSRGMRIATEKVIKK